MNDSSALNTGPGQGTSTAGERFIVSRTSVWDNETSPCEGAVKRPCVRVDRRTTDDPAKIPAHLTKSAWWYAGGRNHRVENGQIARDFDDEAWFIDIQSIRDFVAKHGRVVIGETWRCDDFLEIEIYDDYRE